MIYKVNKKKDLFIFLGSIGLLILSWVNQRNIHYEQILLQFIITISLAGFALFFLFKKTTQGKRIYQYWLDAVDELKRVTWPNKKETMQTTLAVVVMVVVMGIILWLIDAVLIRLVAWLLARGIN